MSHPTWVRGLKSCFHTISLSTTKVAPHVGAWIEISSDTAYFDSLPCRTPRGCVD